ncbi:hypothetical protein GCM10022416_46730 [Actinomadura keratinilytica]|uniref:Uncharacterized protein n=1 Tax=Actinomadura keratinilytica TaxID=547461 RepID=A0ABP7Z989_9ACTN
MAQTAPSEQPAPHVEPKSDLGLPHSTTTDGGFLSGLSGGGGGAREGA